MSLDFFIWFFRLCQGCGGQVLLDFLFGAWFLVL